MPRQPKVEHEDILRDFVANNLHLLEEGLVLEETEHYLPNYEGSKGYIDILAFDKYDNYVIIEIKRRDMAAREALHELHKYVRLLRQNYGASDGDFRLIVVSTEWHQLYSAFAEFKNNSPYMCEGYIAEKSDKIFRISKMDISDSFNTRKISQKHTAIMFESPEERTDSVKNFIEYMTSVGFKDYILVDLDISYRIPFPYMTYICFRRLPEDFYLINTTLRVSEEEREADDIIDDYETDLTIGLLECKLGYTEVSVGYPAKFHNILMEGWKVSKIYKSGIYQKDPRMKDDFLISQISSYAEDNHIIFKTLLNSGNRLRYLSVKFTLLNMLEQNHIWKNYVEKIFEEIERYSGVDIRIHVYNPMNILVNLNESAYEISKRDWIPILTIAAQKGNFSKFYCGHLVWNGRRADFSRLDKVLSSGEHDYFTSFILQNFSEWESRILPSLGLKYSFTTLEPNKLAYNLESKIVDTLYSDFEKFLDNNSVFLTQLENLMSSNILRKRYEEFPEM